MKWLHRILAGLVVVVIMVPLAAGGFWLWLRQGLPAYDGTATLPGLTAPVDIVRDGDGVPHIFAQTDADAYYALGYVHAQDRLWQMDMMRRAGAGRLSEIIGTALGDRMLRTDTLMRTLGFYRQAEASYAALAPEVRQALDAYAAGVNAYLDNRTTPLPIEFQLLRYQPEPWRPADSLVWGKLMALQLSSNYRSELLTARLLERLKPDQIRTLFPTYPTAAPITLAAGLDSLNFERAWNDLAPPLGPDKASNEWVLAGPHTATGKPLLVNDPHLELQAPILWYLARIETPAIKLAGATVPGVPFHILGHNGTIAWGFTTTGSDVQDLFVERTAPDDGTRYLTPDGPQPFEVRQEVIKVRDKADVVLNVRATRHGPVLSDVDGPAAALAGAGPGTDHHVLALAFTALTGNDTTSEGLWRLNRAGNWETFQAALRHIQAPQQNIVYADIAGNIGFLSPALVPVRRNGDGRLPVPGWTGEYDWTGFIPFEELPRAFNPPAGRIINANNAVVGPDYPYLLTTHWDDHYRAARIQQMLDAAGPQSADSAEAMLLDAVSLPARELLPLMLAVRPASALAADAVGALRGWDGVLDRNRPEPLVFEWWLRELNRTLFADELGPLFNDYWALRPRVVAQVLAEDQRWCDDVSTPAPETCQDALRVSLDATLATLARKHGGRLAAWRWGAEHRAPFAHGIFGQVPVLRDLFDIGIETDGGRYTVNQAASKVGDPKTPFADTHGPGFRGVYDLEDLGNSRFMIATGQSGNPLSPHYGDLVARWRDGDHVILTGSKEDIAGRGLGTLRLLPR